MTNIVNQEVTERWAAYHGDTVDVAKGIPDNSVDFSVFSPPFISLYTYSNSPRDMGNCRDSEEFFEHYKHLIHEQMRVMKPGRNISIHCMLLPTSKERDGYIGLRDFRGDIIRAYQAEGFIFHSEVVIWKDPVTAMQRTKALGLLHKQIKKDSAMSRQGIPDYVVTMRKPGENPDPIAHTAEEFPVDLWQKYASPIWMDIDPSDTLQYRSAREHDDERHICLAKGSLVLTRDGYIPIEEVKIGDMVLTHTGNWKPVTGRACNGVHPIVSTTAQGVADLRTTPDHKLWTRAVGQYSNPRQRAKSAAPDWMEAKDTLGSYLNLKLPQIEESEYSVDEWWIIGRWLGDGHVDTRNRYHISCSHHETAELLRRLGSAAGHVAKNRTANQIAIKDPTGRLRRILQKFGSGAANKRIPAEGITLNKEKSEALLSGYLSADGHYVKKYNRTCASSVSRALLLGLAIVAQRARGVVASVYAGRGPRDHVIEGRTVKAKQDWVFTFSENFDSKTGMSGMILDDGAWKKVRKIEDAGTAEVWDISVEDDESFTAEGCIVKNCPLQIPVIERLMFLWSRPNDIVWSPFMGIGSEGHVALKMKRRFIGAELKTSYYEQAVRNLKEAACERQGSLF